MKSDIEQKKEIAAELKAARLKAGLTQKQAAEKSGCSQSVISMMERGSRRVSAVFERKLLEIYNAAENPVDEVQKSTSVNAVEMLLKLSALGGDELETAVDNYISVCAYLLMRDIYTSNPKNSDREFSVSREVAEQMKAIIADEPESIMNFIKYSRQVDRLALTPDPLMESELREVIESCEQIIKK